MMTPTRESVGGLGFGITLLDELEDLRRWDDLRLGRLQDRIPPRRLPRRERLAEIAPVGIFAGNL